MPNRRRLRTSHASISQSVPSLTSIPLSRPDSTTKPRSVMWDASSKRHERRIERRQRDLRALQVGRRPEVQTARAAVDDELAGLIQFLQHVQGAVAARRRVALHEAVDVRRGQRDPVRGGIDRGDLDHLVVPVVAPVALEPHALRCLPARRPVACILEAPRQTALVAVARTRAGLHDPGDGRPALVRPAGEGHAAVR